MGKLNTREEPLVQFVQDQTILHEDYIFDEKTHLFIDFKRNCIASLNDVTEFQISLKSKGDARLIPVWNALNRCLKRVRDPNPYENAEDDQNVWRLDESVNNLRPLRSPIYVCNVCENKGGFIKDYEHIENCEKNTEKIIGFTKYLGYCYGSPIDRKFFVFQKWDEVTDGPTGHFLESSVSWIDESNLNIANVIQYNEKFNLFKGVKTNEILNPYTLQIEKYLEQQNVEQFDSILHVVNQHSLLDEAPNYYLIGEEKHNLTSIDEKPENFAATKRPICICHGCERAAFEDDKASKVLAYKHIKNCKKAITRFELTVYSQYYKLIVLDDDFNERSHFLVCGDDFKKFTDFESYAEGRALIDAKDEDEDEDEDDEEEEDEEDEEEEEDGNEVFESAEEYLEEEDQVTGPSEVNEADELATKKLQRVLSSEEDEVISDEPTQILHSSPVKRAKTDTNSTFRLFVRSSSSSGPDTENKDGNNILGSGGLWRSDEIESLDEFSDSPPLDKYSEDEGYLGDDGYDANKTHRVIDIGNGTDVDVDLDSDEITQEYEQYVINKGSSGLTAGGNNEVMTTLSSPVSDSDDGIQVVEEQEFQRSSQNKSTNGTPKRNINEFPLFKREPEITSSSLLKRSDGAMNKLSTIPLITSSNTFSESEVEGSEYEEL